MDERLEVEVRASSDLTPQEREATGLLSGSDVDDHRFAGFEWAPAQWYVLGKLGGSVVSALKLVVRDITVGARRVRVGGIGDVATRSDMRRRGYAAAVMRRAAAYLCNETDVEFGLLFCAPELVHYYARLGWQRLDGPTTVVVPWGKAAFPGETMVLPCRQHNWPGGPVDLEGLPW